MIRLALLILIAVGLVALFNAPARPQHAPPGNPADIVSHMKVEVYRE